MCGENNLAIEKSRIVRVQRLYGDHVSMLTNELKCHLAWPVASRYTVNTQALHVQCLELLVIHRRVERFDNEGGGVGGGVQGKLFYVDCGGWLYSCVF